jgi:XTP/dITP diphosphohydrolase
VSDPKLLIASHNLGKIREYRHLLRDLPLELVSPDDLGIYEEIAETGNTFAENAWLKAGGYGGLSGMLTLSDDSGLEVDALDGEPGIHSARYGGDSCASDEERVQLLLRNLAGVPREKRTARFRCVIAICGPDGRKASVVGSVAGMIQYEPEGNEGFGYDPVFYLPSYGQTMSQIPLAAKNRISHRSDATGRAVAVLKKLVETGQSPQIEGA